MPTKGHRPDQRLGITQKSAWHLAHRIRKAWEITEDRFTGLTEADEHYVERPFQAHTHKEI